MLPWIRDQAELACGRLFLILAAPCSPKTPTANRQIIHRRVIALFQPRYTTAVERSTETLMPHGTPGSSEIQLRRFYGRLRLAVSLTSDIVSTADRGAYPEKGNHR